MLSCNIRFSAPRLWMGGGLERHCVGHVYGVDGAVHHTHDLRTNLVQKTICCNSTSNAPDDGHMRPKHAELRTRQ